ncbi:MAG: phenylalanine--tRNA ligase subunit alpha [Nanoarchaeota archaeon]|nr:phenylalanine--tRNA ligase subunit alpha [Nanoarchaeota archaeon]MBU4124311.1 phenylalanine--tRNA ligase subunit alpha [Nanoarchaeota archaeon]
MYQLTEEGKKYLKEGLPEKNLLKILPKSMSDVSKQPNAAISIGWAKKNNWIKIANGVIDTTDEGIQALKEKNEIENALHEINDKGNSNLSKMLLSRKLIEEETAKPLEPIKQINPIISFFQKLFKKKETAVEQKTEITEIAQLTPEMIRSGLWKSVPFRNYDIYSPAPKVYPGKRQHYVQFMEEIKDKLIGLGFEEMTGPMVETSFWNCDALFMPQDHPARGVHDVLIVKKPSQGILPDQNLISKVKATHEGGWVTGSTGWGGTWSPKVASKLMMRSQTTAVSARKLYEHGDKPGKYFTIDRTFRYDVIDSRHLDEFDQCEGIVIGENLTLQNLLGYLQEFADMIGAEKVKFKPSYFPFTEPSVEMYVYFEKFGWIELGGAGIMRPEVLKPLGIEKCQVLAWGLGIGRLAMFKAGINDIRQLYSEDLKWMRELPVIK